MTTPTHTPGLRSFARNSEIYRFVFSGAYQGVLLVGNGIEDCNDTACQLLGRDRHRLLGVDPLALTPATQRNGSPSTEVARQRLSAVQAGQAQWFEWRFLRDDGHSVDTLVNMEAVRVDGAKRLLLRVRDISHLERSEEALRGAALAVSTAEGDTVFRELVRHLASYLETDLAFIALPCEQDRSRLRMLAFYLDGKMVEDFEYPMLGTPCETVIGQQFRIYPSGLAQRFPIDEDFKALGLDCYAGYPLSGARGEPLGLIAVVGRKPFGSAERVESLLRIFAARAVSEIEHRRSDQALRSAEASYRAIFDSAEDPIFIHDWDTGAVVDVNRKACEVYGYSYQELRDIHIRDISSGEPGFTATEAAAWIERAKHTGGAQFEWHRRNRDGSLHWDEVRLKSAVISGKPHVLAFTREITERKRAEEERTRLEAQLRQAQKMEAIGHLTGGIAHDFNNILTSIMGYVALAADRPTAAADSKLERYLEQAQSGVRRARDLIQQMLTFSRGQRGDPRPVALGPLVRESMKLLRSTLPATVEIDTRIARELPAVMLDPVHLEQVLLNLCINARDAMGGSGDIHASAEVVEIAEATCASCHQRVHGRFVELAVKDSGPGISPEVLDRMFEPFFTTKDAGKGSGMGLATVHGIVHEYGGHICVDTALGAGTRFVSRNNCKNCS